MHTLWLLGKTWIGISGLKLRVRCENLIFLFLNQKYVVGTQKNRLNETVLLSTQNIMLKLMGKKIFTILRWNFLFI